MSSMADALALLEKELGKNDEEQAVTQWIDTGYPPLNKAISGRYDGGLPYGRLVEMYGDSSTGKTALATKWMVQAQRLGGIAGFIDWERSFNVELAKGFGLNDERPHWFYYRPKTWEEGNMKATKATQLLRKAGVIAPDAPILWVFDSIAAALPQSQAEKEIDQYTMNDTTALARVTSSTLKTQAFWAGELNATFLYLNQTRTKPGVVYGDPTTTPGGKAMEFYASARVALSRSKIMENAAGGKEFAGQNVGAKVVKSKFTKPFQEVDLRLTFDDLGVAHFDYNFTLIEYLIAEGKLEYSKPRVTWIDGKKYFIKELAEKVRAEGLESQLRGLLLAAAA